MNGSEWVTGALWTTTRKPCKSCKSHVSTVSTVSTTGNASASAGLDPSRPLKLEAAGAVFRSRSASPAQRLVCLLRQEPLGREAPLASVCCTVAGPQSLTGLTRASVLPCEVRSPRTQAAATAGSEEPRRIAWRVAWMTIRAGCWSMATSAISTCTRG